MYLESVGKQQFLTTLQKKKKGKIVGASLASSIIHEQSNTIFYNYRKMVLEVENQTRNCLFTSTWFISHQWPHAEIL